MRGVMRRLLSRWYHLVMGVAVGRYYCPVCQRRVFRFMPIDPGIVTGGKSVSRRKGSSVNEFLHAEQYSCPHCRASDRSRLYAVYVRDYLAQHAGNNAVFLDIAPVGSLSKYFKRIVPQHRGWSYVSLDLNIPTADIQADISAMPAVESDSVDFFICSHVLEHVPDDKAAMRELYRILRPSGAGIAMVPINLGVHQTDEDPSVTDPEERIRRFGQHDHVRRYAKTDFIARLEQAGFRVCLLGMEHFGNDLYRRLGLKSNSLLYIVHKD